MVHVAWVISVAPVLERAEEVTAAFGVGHVGQNLIDNIKYLFNPFVFPGAVSVFALLSLFSNSPPKLERGVERCKAGRFPYNHACASRQP